jgi:hypothetical protein
MSLKALSKVDIVTWLINVKHKWQKETENHWANPSLYPFMREVLHESVHFWQAIGLPYFLRVSCRAYRDFQEVRACAFRDNQQKPVPMDQLKLEPNYFYFSSVLGVNYKYGELSGADLLEGLARYWDIHLCGMRHAIDRLIEEGKISQQDVVKAEQKHGNFFLNDGINFTDAAVRFVFDQERLYNKAYDFTVHSTGRYAYILFPIMGFFALSSGGQSVTKFQEWITIWEDTKPFEIPKGNFLKVWRQCFKQAFKWISTDLKEQVYSSLTVYNHLRKKMTAWQIKSSFPSKFGLLTPHGVLDRYIRNYWQLMREKRPTIHDQDVELHFHEAFCLPGDPFFRDILLNIFHPPVIIFSDQKNWLDGKNWGEFTAALEKDLIAFGGQMGSAMALSGMFDAKSLKVSCPHTQCDWHRSKLCWKVLTFPDEAENCIMPNLYQSQMNIDLPLDKDWDIGMIDHPLAKNHSHLLSIELF